MDKQKILVTSALPYVNNIPHLGNLVPILSADVYSRFKKIQNENCIFVCGTDEHGTTAEIKAKEEGITPEELTNKYFKIHKQIYQWFNFDIDCFGRTSSKMNHEISQDIFIKLYNNGFIIEKEISQMWDEIEKCFLSDRFIQGTCPYCNFENARGDQCDNCGKLLEPIELINPISSISNTKPIIKKSNHLFIDLHKIEINQNLEKDLTTWIEENKSKWTNNAISTTQAWIKEGLQPRCITRDLKWGVQVPYKQLNLPDEYKNKVLYSWFDAPIGYISITNSKVNLADEKNNVDYKEWWKDKNTNLVQFMGKDNTPFHTILFPSFCIGAKDDYILMKEISVNEYINYEGGKFSKSRNVGVFGDSAIESGIVADIYRYYLMAMRPEKEDTDFDWGDLQIKVNKELIGNLGNLINRVLTFVSNFCNGIIQDDEIYIAYENTNFELIKDLNSQIKIKQTLQEILKISSEGNVLFQTLEPWVSIKSNPNKTIKDLAILSRRVKDLAILIYPFMPESAEKIIKQMNLPKEIINWNNLNKPLPRNLKINSNLVKPLFTKLEDEEVIKLKRKFGCEVKEKFPLNLKVAKILSAKEHPNAEKLLVLEIDIGEEKPRQIVAGLKKHYSPEELINLKIIVVSNLEYAKLRGELSQGMLLAGVYKNEEGIELVKIISPKHSNIGEKVFFEGNEAIKEDLIKYEEFAKYNINILEQKIYLGDPKKKEILKTLKETLSVKLQKGKVC